MMTSAHSNNFYHLLTLTEYNDFFLRRVALVIAEVNASAHLTELCECESMRKLINRYQLTLVHAVSDHELNEICTLGVEIINKVRNYVLETDVDYHRFINRRECA